MQVAPRSLSRWWPPPTSFSLPSGSRTNAVTESGTATSTESPPAGSCCQDTDTGPCRVSSAARAQVIPPPGRGAIRTSRVARLERGDAADGPVHPVGDRAEGVVVEAGHLAGVDGAVGQHRVPALPDRRRAHGHRVEPGGALGLQQQPVGVVQVAGAGQGVGHERRAGEPGLDVEPALRDQLGQPLAGQLDEARRRGCRTRWPARSGGGIAVDGAVARRRSARGTPPGSGRPGRGTRGLAGRPSTSAAWAARSALR